MFDVTILREILGVLAPVALIVCIGFWLEKTTDIIVTKQLSTLVMTVGTPALVFSSLTRTALPFDELMSVSAGALCATGIATIIALLVIWIGKFEVRTYLAPLTMPNSGNLGLPLVLLAFGQDGLAIGISFFFVVAIIQYTAIPIVVTGSFSLKRLVKEPLIWGVIGALAFKSTEAPVPQVIDNTTEILGGMMIPIMLILLGSSIARLKIADMKVATFMAFVRLFAGLIGGVGAVLLLGLTGPTAGAVFLLAAMPSAVVCYVIAQRYEQEPEKVASLVVSSTFLILLVLPVLIWVAIHIADGSLFAP